MEFFDKLGKKASEAYKVTADKTGKLAKEAKIRMKINEMKGQIKDIYEEIGKKVYEKHVREENIDISTELEEECTKIDVLSAEIETCLKSILELKDQKVCPKCNKTIDKTSAFCPYCGEKQPESECNEEAKEPKVILEELESVEINPENEAEKEIVKEKLEEEIEENENEDEDKEKEKKEEKLNENSGAES